MLNNVFRTVLLVCVFSGFSASCAHAAKLPALDDVPKQFSKESQEILSRQKVIIERELAAFQADSKTFNAKNADDQTDEEYNALMARRELYISHANAFNKNIAEQYFYALQTRTLTPMADGGHPLDSSGSPPAGLHGLVGGTTWTYGFKWPQVKCEEKCQSDIKKSLDSQLMLYCSSQNDSKKCLAEGLPFSPDLYDMVVSMGSSHAALDDLATRVLFDGASFGEYSRQNKEIFASLKGRQFETLDCHSNGAMLCLAALRSGDTQAKEVRLFGPQLNPEAAKRWQEYAADTGATIKIYINAGDPVPALSWKLPAPPTSVDKSVTTAAWISHPAQAVATTLGGAAFNAYLDSKTGVMDDTLKNYGFDVKRSYSRDGCCNGAPDIACHSMKLYEQVKK